MFKGLGNLASLMRNASQMGERMKVLGESLKSQRVTATAGGGMIEVEANGLGEILRVRIEPQLFEKGERQLVEDLLPTAINQVVAKARELHMEAMREQMGGMDLPGMDEMLGSLKG